MNHVYERSFDDPPRQDEVIAAAMEWHFNPGTGSGFWLQQARSWSFDPRRDVKRREDLSLFPDVSAALRQASLEDLVPAGCKEGSWGFGVYESGGTTGRPRRIVEMSSRRRGVEWVSRILDEHGFPSTGAGSWLHVGPTGPHIVGRSIGLLAQLRRAFCYYIDFDPRWVKRCLREGRTQDARRYADHLIDQAVEVIRTEPVSVLFATPPILETICSRPEILALFQRKIRGILWAGTSISPETLRLVEEELFPEAKVVGLYGNTLMGIACQRPSRLEDDLSCVFQPFHPFCIIDVVDPEAPGRSVGYGARGQVSTTLLTPEMFLPGNLESDSALRTPPVPGYPCDGVADVRPLSSGVRVFEGVY